MSEQRSSVTIAVQWAQLVVLVIGVAGIFLTIGRKDAML